MVQDVSTSLDESMFDLRGENALVLEFLLDVGFGSEHVGVGTAAFVVLVLETCQILEVGVHLQVLLVLHDLDFDQLVVAHNVFANQIHLLVQIVGLEVCVELLDVCSLAQDAHVVAPVQPGRQVEFYDARLVELLHVNRSVLYLLLRNLFVLYLVEHYKILIRINVMIHNSICIGICIGISVISASKRKSKGSVNRSVVEGVRKHVQCAAA